MLTSLGTFLGVGSLVAVLGLTASAGAQIGRRFDALAATQVLVEDLFPERTYDPPFPPDADSRIDALNGVTAAGVLWTPDTDDEGVRARWQRDARGSDGLPLQVVAASPGALLAAGVEVDVGRQFDTFHDGRGERVALLGAAAASQLGVSDLGHQPAVFVGDNAFTVVGIIGSARRQADLLLSVVIPDGTARTVWGLPPRGPQRMLIETRPGAAQLISTQAPLALRPDAPDRFKVVSPADPKTLRAGVVTDVNTLLVLLTGVSLLVGAVGIANTTLVSVLERVSEIGLRRALGATRRQIALQFLTESMALGSLGGIVGACLGMAAIVVVAFLRDWTAVLPSYVVLAAPLLGTVTGLAAGFYPSLRASRIQPVDALRR